MMNTSGVIATVIMTLRDRRTAELPRGAPGTGSRSSGIRLSVHSRATRVNGQALSSRKIDLTE